MIDLSVNLCGKQLKNPIIAASGTFGFGEEYSNFYDINILGGISVKGLTPVKRIGNPAPRIAEVAGGMLNAVGLQNPGIDAFISEYLPKLGHLNSSIIANIAGNSLEDYELMAMKLKGKAIDFIELNISCPNVKQGGVHFGVQPEAVKEVTAVVKKHCTVPLIVKLTPNVSDIAQNALAAQEGGADCVSLINTLTAMAVDPISKRPIIANVTGGMSGACIKPIALRMVHQVYKAVKIPIIGMGGIMAGTDVVEFMLCGASAVMVGTANIIDPYACPRIIKELESFMIEQGVQRVSEFTGALKS